MFHPVAGRCTRMVITFVIYGQVIARLELRSGYRRAVPPWGRNTIQQRTSRFPATPRVSAWCSPGALNENSKVRRVCRAVGLLGTEDPGFGRGVYRRSKQISALLKGHVFRR